VDVGDVGDRAHTNHLAASLATGLNPLPPGKGRVRARTRNPWPFKRSLPANRPRPNLLSEGEGTGNASQATQLNELRQILDYVLGSFGCG
jgi:hypothetical protein